MSVLLKQIPETAKIVRKEIFLLKKLNVSGHFHEALVIEKQFHVLIISGNTIKWSNLTI